MGHYRRMLTLAALAVIGQAIAYVLSVVLARRLGVEGYEAYAVASAAFLLMVTEAPQGVDKYTLRFLPALIERRDWARAIGLLRFSLRRALWGALLAGAVVGLWAWQIRDFAEGVRLAVLVSCVTLPAGALVHYGMEALNAAGAPIRASIIFRIGVPALTLILVCILLVLRVDVSGAMAVACWGLAWIVAMVAMAIEFRRVAPAEVWRTRPVEEPRTWAREARPFWVYRVSLGLMGYVGVIALDWLHPSAEDVGAYSAAMGTVTLALVLATGTNRAYSQALSVLLERGDVAAMIDVRRKRLRWLLPAVVVFLLITFTFTDELLALFRVEFVDDGATALRVLAAATAFTMLFSLAPTHLKLRRRNRATFVTVVSAAIVQIALLVVLVPRYGADGAAVAYAVSMVGMYGAFAVMARRDLAQLRTGEFGEPPRAL